MAYDAFLRIDGIPGESQDSNHKDWIEVLSFSWGETNAGRGGFAGGAAGGRRVSFQDFHVSTLASKASPSLFQACANGQHIRTATLSLAHSPSDSSPSGAAAGSPDFLTYQLSEVFVSSYQTGGALLDDGTYSPIGANGNGFSAELPVEQITLNFAKLEIAYTSAADGSTADLAAGID